MGNQLASTGAGNPARARLSPQARIVVCGVVYAANLGDGVIAECMAHVLKKHWPDTPVLHLDLSTRETYGETAVSGKRRILALLRHSPGFINTMIVAAGLKAFLVRKAAPAWEDYFRAQDVVVIGGGHLLSDFNLNFPSKLALLSRIAARAGARLGLHAVGVSGNWSKRATQLFDTVLSRCASVSVRDEASLRHLAAHVPGLEVAPSIAADPGYIARLQYADVVPVRRGIGLNISNPDELAQYDAKAGGKSATRPDYDGFWIGLLREYLRRGSPVTMFTNGAEEDEEYLDRLVRKAAAAGLSGFDRRPRPRAPAELVGMIKGLDLLIGHRLHAHIVAFAHGVPAVALGWDDKLQGQMELMGRGELLLPFEAADAGQALALADRVMQAPADDERARDMERRAEDDLVSTIDTLIAGQ